MLQTIRQKVTPADRASGTAAGGLYAGFGNRDKDALAYLSSGIPPERVFIIDTSSKILGRAAVIAPDSSAGDGAGNGGANPGGDGSEAITSSSSSSGDGVAAAEGTSRSADVSSALRAAQPAWQSYSGMLAATASLERLFPARCAQSKVALGLAQYAALAADGLSKPHERGLW